MKDATKVLISVDVQSLRRIDQLADAAGMNRSAYMVMMALGGNESMALIVNHVDQMREQMHDNIKRLERLVANLK